MVYYLHDMIEDYADQKDMIEFLISMKQEQEKQVRLSIYVSITG